MKARNRRAAMALFLAVTLLFAATACSASAASSLSEQELQKLGQDFVNEIAETLLPYRERPNEMAEQGAVVVSKALVDGTTKEIAYGSEYLEDFQAQLNREENCEVTVVFSSTALVISRIAMNKDGTGYYIRYQYDPDSASVPVSIKPISRVDISWDNQPQKVEIEVLNGKAKVGAFTLRNLTRIF